MVLSLDIPPKDSHMQNRGGVEEMNSFRILITQCVEQGELSTTLYHHHHHQTNGPDCGIWVTGLRTNSAAKVAAQLYQSFRSSSRQQRGRPRIICSALSRYWLVDTSIALMHIEHIVGAINYNPGNDDDTPG